MHPLSRSTMVYHATPHHGLAGLQSLIDQAQDGDEIHCAPGLFRGEASVEPVGGGRTIGARLSPVELVLVGSHC